VQYSSDFLIILKSSDLRVVASDDHIAKKRDCLFVAFCRRDGEVGGGARVSLAYKKKSAKRFSALSAQTECFDEAI